MVAAGHPLATLEAVQVLRGGGNAVDAAVCAAAVLAVVKPQACGIGGDVFALLAPPGSAMVYALNGSGRAPAGATRERFLPAIPEEGIRSATVPGAVDAWAQALARFGTRPLGALLEPAIGYAEHGCPVSAHLARSIQLHAESLRRDPRAAALFFRDGQPLAEGELLVQQDLARSLRAIAADGPGAFYRGEVGQALVRYAEGQGGHLTMEDLAGHTSTWGESLSTTYRGYIVHQPPPNSWGLLLLLQLNLLEGLGLGRLAWSAPQRLHLMVEAKKLAFADGARWLGDPEFTPIPIETLLSKAYARERRRLIDRQRASLGPEPGLPPAGTDTTYLAVVDERGMAVSWIQSLFETFGAQVVAGETGMWLNNRLTGFTLEPGHPNCLAPGRRPAHTLSPAMAFRDGHLCLVFGTPSAPGQTQGLTQIFTNLVEFGMELQEAIEAPRWLHLRGSELLLEDRFPARLRAGLARRGHQVVALEPWDTRVGGAQAILVDRERGCLVGGADPRRDGYALGW